MSAVANLNNKSKSQLMDLVKSLTSENTALKEIVRIMESTNERLEKLEREQNKSLQYLRRDTIEISGIPSEIHQNELEKEILKVFQAAEVKVHGENLQERDIQAAHRIGKKGVVICKFVNRKFAREGLFCGRNLKGKNVYNNSNVYINDSLCREFKYLNFVVRKSKNDNIIFRWKVRNGITFVQKKDGDEFEEISHKSDLIRLGLLESE